MDVSVVVFSANLIELLKNIFWLEFDSSHEMCSTFLRFQEFYESPKFANQAFTLDEFKTWYQGDLDEFTYYDDWSGFNIPSRILKPFREGAFDPLSPQEQYLLSLFDGKEDPYYIIGTSVAKMPTPSTEDKLVLQHETAHGLFCANGDYQKEVLKVLENLAPTTRQKMHEWLAWDYAESSITDEIHAYLLDGPHYLETQGIISDDIESISNQLHQIYEKYYQIQKEALAI